MKYMERQKKYLSQISKWEKQKNKSIQQMKNKNEQKWGQAKANLSDVIYDRDRQFNSIIEK